MALLETSKIKKIRKSEKVKMYLNSLDPLELDRTSPKPEASKYVGR
jgi:hypothetical protein